MACVRLSKSGKSLLFIDDRGFMFTIPNNVLNMIVNGNSRSFHPLTLVPLRMDSTIIPKSNLFIDGEALSLSDAFDKGLISKNFWLSSLEVKNGSSAEVKGSKPAPRVVQDVRL